MNTLSARPHLQLQTREKMLPFEPVLAVAFIVISFLLYRTVQSKIVVFGGALFGAIAVAALVGKPERITHQVNARELEAAISQSNDYQIYKESFYSASARLVEDGKCSVSQLKEVGGWLKSPTHINQNVYFTYCGPMSVSSRIYLNAQTGEVFR